jgi:4,5-DOPA dioxygenase extradiol
MSGSDWQRSAPTPEHFMPLAPIAGIAAATGVTAEVVIEGATMGSLTMTSYIVY